MFGSISKIWISVIFIMLAIGGGYLWLNKAALFHVYKNEINSENPELDIIMESGFEGYKSEEHLLSALYEVFPKGAKQSDVDRVLIKSAGLSKYKSDHTEQGTYVVYKKRGLQPNTSHPLKTARFLFDTSGNLIGIEASFMDGISIKYFYGERIQ